MKDFSESQKNSNNSNDSKQSMINLDDEDIQVTGVVKGNSRIANLSNLKIGHGKSILIDDEIEASAVKKLDKTETKFEAKVDNSSTVNVKEKLGGTKQKKITDFFKKKN